MRNLRRIGVLAGGDSPEREVSLISGESVYRALSRLGHTASLIEIDTLDDIVPNIADIRVVFNCLHGGSGEDGTVQLLFDVMGIPYTGSGPQASARAMDKVRAKEIFAARRIPTPRWAVYGGGGPQPFVDKLEGSLSYPLVVKPRYGGSTIGVVLVEDGPELCGALRGAAEGETLVEEFIPGRELTVGILRGEGGDSPLPIVDIECDGGLFSYRAKYTEGVARFIVPADLPDGATARTKEAALAAHRELGCTGFSRVDIRLSEDGTPYVLEVNTIPGMTPLSDLPRAARAAGIGFDELVEWMLKTAEKEGG